jgi:RNA polymerase-interacting CarD/CdnL/TRCF family regulator
MSEQNPRFHMGDQVIHRAYGFGTITQIDEKELSGITIQYYVVAAQNLTLWVPANEEGEESLRFPTPPEDFQKFFDILSAPGEPLSDDRLVRRTQLIDRLKTGTLDSICQVVRDLTLYKRTKKMNDYDTASLERAKTSLLREWSFALSVPYSQAEQDLKQMLQE